MLEDARKNSLTIMMKMLTKNPVQKFLNQVVVSKNEIEVSINQFLILMVRLSEKSPKSGKHRKCRSFSIRFILSSVTAPFQYRNDN